MQSISYTRNWTPKLQSLQHLDTKVATAKTTLACYDHFVLWLTSHLPESDINSAPGIVFMVHVETPKHLSTRPALWFATEDEAQKHTYQITCLFGLVPSDLEAVHLAQVQKFLDLDLPNHMPDIKFGLSHLYSPRVL